MKYDLIIIGAGPGSLSAGIYAGRYDLKTLIIGKLPGGTATYAHLIENFPSYEKITGTELMIKMIKQVQKFNIEILQEEVLEISKKENFIIKTNKNNYSAKKVIIATGKTQGKLELENEERLIGKGISYCATCDAGFYKDKIVGVVGGGNSALSAAVLLSKFAKKVYIIYRRDKFFRAEPAWIKEIEKNSKIKCLFNSKINKLIGKEKLEKVELENGKELELDGLFIEIGGTPETYFLEKIGVNLDKAGYIKVDESQKTNIKGLYAIGDVTNNKLKQIITACSDGAIAANSVYEELNKEI